MTDIGWTNYVKQNSLVISAYSVEFVKLKDATFLTTGEVSTLQTDRMAVEAGVTQMALDVKTVRKKILITEKTVKCLVCKYIELKDREAISCEDLNAGMPYLTNLLTDVIKPDYICNYAEQQVKLKFCKPNVQHLLHWMSTLTALEW